MIKISRIFLSGIFLFFVTSTDVFAYFDPGTGGYLITALLTSIGGFLAVSSAVVIHFFRKTLRNFIVALWSRHRAVAVLLILFILLGVCSGLFLLLKKKSPEGGLVPTASLSQ